MLSEFVGFPITIKDPFQLLYFRNISDTRAHILTAILLAYRAHPLIWSFTFHSLSALYLVPLCSM
jgi:hypothetical protein